MRPSRCPVWLKCKGPEGPCALKQLEALVRPAVSVCGHPAQSLPFGHGR